MELSSKSEYAILALMELTTHYERGEPIQIRQIAAQQNIPDRYLEQLLAILRRAGLVRSQRGAKGGYLLAREPWTITMLDIVSCIEGYETKFAERQAALETVECGLISDIWQEVIQSTATVLQKYTLKDLAEKRDAKQRQDIMYYI